jgi:transposase
VADGRSSHPGAEKPVAQHGISSAFPSKPDSRLGRKASPIAQGRLEMDAIVVGIQRQARHRGSAARSGFCHKPRREGPEGLIAHLKPLALEALVATGGFETVVAANLPAEGLPVIVANPAQVSAFAKALGQRAKTDPIEPWSSLVSPWQRSRQSARFRMNDLVCRRRQIIEMIVAEKQRGLARERRPSHLRPGRR